MTFEEWWETDDNPWKGADKLSEYSLAKSAWNAAIQNRRAPIKIKKVDMNDKYHDFGNGQKAW